MKKKKGRVKTKSKCDVESNTLRLPHAKMLLVPMNFFRITGRLDL